MNRLSPSRPRNAALTAEQRLALEVDQAGDEAERLGAVRKDEIARVFAELDEEWGAAVAEPGRPRPR